MRRLLHCIPIMVLFCGGNFNISPSDITGSIARDFCPYTDFCTFNKTETFIDTSDGTYTPCCRQCSCDETCWMLDTCCPDITTTRPPGHDPVTCKDTQFEYAHKTIPMSSSRLFIANKQQMIDNCPLGYNGSMKCVNSSTIKPESLDDIVIVSDARNHNRIFKNKHCAECHGVTNIERWNLEIWGCEPHIYEVSLRPTELFDFILTRCNLVSTPTKQIVLETPPYCPPVTYLVFEVNECNVTGSWRHYDANIESACLFSHNPFTVDLDFLTYRNIFCYVCNHAIVGNLFDVCLSERLDSRAFGPEFSSVLDLNIGQAPETEVDGYQCETTEIYDSILKECRRVNCAINSSPYYGKCLANTKDLKGLQVIVILKLIPNKPEVIDEELEKYGASTVEGVVPNLLKSLGLARCHQLCRTTARVYVDNGKLLHSVSLNIVLGLAQKCNIEFMMRWLREMVKGINVSVPINGKGVRLTVDVDVETEFETVEETFSHNANENRTGYYLGTLFEYYAGLCNGFSIILNGKLFCPYLLFNLVEYRKIESRVMQIKESVPLNSAAQLENLLPNFVQTSSKNNIKMVAVCVTDYTSYSKNRSTTFHKFSCAFRACFIALIIFCSLNKMVLLRVWLL